MDKRYQVFISSTYKDLEIERSMIFQTLMEMDCIPAGMELFPSIDEEQWEFIKKIINDSDYYLLIIGGRYGTIADDGLSYTEKEFDYAVSCGLKVIVLVHQEPETLPLSKSESSPELREKLSKFIDKASNGRLRKTWKSANDLPGLVSLSLNKTIKSYPAIGWVRSDRITNEETLQELNNLRKNNEELKKSLNKYEGFKINFSLEELAPLDQEHIFWFTSSHYDSSAGEDIREKSSFKTSWGMIFSIIAPYITEETNESEVVFLIKNHLKNNITPEHYNINIDQQEVKTFQLQFIALGLLDFNVHCWKLSQNGVKTMMQLRTVKRK